MAAEKHQIEAIESETMEQGDKEDAPPPDREFVIKISPMAGVSSVGDIGDGVQCLAESIVVVVIDQEDFVDLR